MKQTNETMFFYKKGYQKEKETKSDQEFRENNFLNYKNGIQSTKVCENSNLKRLKSPTVLQGKTEVQLGEICRDGKILSSLQWNSHGPFASSFQF